MNDNLNLLGLTTQITCALLTTKAPVSIEPGALPGFIQSIYDTLAGLGKDPEPAVEHIPAIDPKKSIKHDHIISLIDGKPYKMLKRHLATHGLTPDEYRERYGLRPDYPMTARGYADRRREIAKQNGLGRNAHPRRGRHKKAAAR
jgi:predicted transcriptional regulator